MQKTFYSFVIHNLHCLIYIPRDLHENEFFNRVCYSNFREFRCIFFIILVKLTS